MKENNPGLLVANSDTLRAEYAISPRRANKIARTTPQNDAVAEKTLDGDCWDVVECGDWKVPAAVRLKIESDHA